MQHRQQLLPSGTCDMINEFQCNNGICIPLNMTCNRYDDCGDNSDEDIDCKSMHDCHVDYSILNCSKNNLSFSPLFSLSIS